MSGGDQYALMDARDRTGRTVDKTERCAVLPGKTDEFAKLERRGILEQNNTSSKIRFNDPTYSMSAHQFDIEGSAVGGIHPISSILARTTDIVFMPCADGVSQAEAARHACPPGLSGGPHQWTVRVC